MADPPLTGQVLAAFEGRLSARFDGLDSRLDALEERFDILEGRLNDLHGQGDCLHHRLERLDAEYYLIALGLRRIERRLGPMDQ